MNDTKVIEAFLEGVEFPADRDDIIEASVQEEADESIIQFIELVPEGTYNSPQEVLESIQNQNSAQA